MKPRSAKNKGNRFENYLIEYLREHLDSKAQRTYGSGSGLDKQDVKLPSYEIEIEAKNQKAIHLLDWWEQCKSQEFGNMAVLALRNPRKAEFQEVLIVMGMDDWIELVKKQKDQVEIISNFDRELKWRIKRLEQAAHEVFKELNN